METSPDKFYLTRGRPTYNIYFSLADLAQILLQVVIGCHERYYARDCVVEGKVVPRVIIYHACELIDLVFLESFLGLDFREGREHVRYS